MVRTSALAEIYTPSYYFLPTNSPRTASDTTTLDTPEAYAKWGAAGDFSTDFQGSSFEVKNSKDTSRDRYSYSEEGRSYKDYKIKNSTDPEQYVIVRRVDTIVFSGPGGAQFTLHLANDTVGTQEGSGQNPEGKDLDKL